MERLVIVYVMNILLRTLVIDATNPVLEGSEIPVCWMLVLIEEIVPPSAHFYLLNRASIVERIKALLVI